MPTDRMLLPVKPLPPPIGKNGAKYAESRQQGDSAEYAVASTPRWSRSGRDGQGGGGRVRTGRDCGGIEGAGQARGRNTGELNLALESSHRARVDRQTG
jgi:hypothetical protein